MVTLVQFVLSTHKDYQPLAKAYKHLNNLKKGLGNPEQVENAGTQVRAISETILKKKNIHYQSLNNNSNKQYKQKPITIKFKDTHNVTRSVVVYPSNRNYNKLAKSYMRWTKQSEQLLKVQKKQGFLTDLVAKAKTTILEIKVHNSREHLNEQGKSIINSLGLNR